MLSRTLLATARQSTRVVARSSSTSYLRFLANTSVPRLHQTQTAKMPVDSSSAQTKDPYVEKTLKDASPKQKVEEIQKIIADTKTCMLTTRSSDGAMHSRAMAPASKEAPFKFEYIFNSESGKADEIENDSTVNVSVYNSSTTDWISVAGKARISTDKARIKEIFNPIVSAWFGDLNDGVHDGSASDPRVQLIVVEPEEIRYWHQTQTQIGSLVNQVTSAVTGKTANPGVLRTLTKAELAEARS